jgi:hypothetical protein
MIAKVAVTVEVIVKLNMTNGDDTTIGDLRAEARKAAVELVRVGLFHANKEVKDYNAPKLSNEGRDVQAAVCSTGIITIE